MKRLILLLLATAVVSVALGGLSASAATTAVDPILGTWDLGGGGQVVVTGGPTSFIGTVSEPTSLSECVHPVGQVIWAIQAGASPGHYTGTHVGFHTPECTPFPGWPSTWDVSVSSGTYTLHFCDTVPAGADNSGVMSCTDLQRAAPDFSIDVSPTSATTAAGGSVVYTLSAKTFGGFTASLTLGVDGRPAGVGFSYPAWTGSVAITVSTAQTTPPGTYPLMISANGGGITHSSPVSLVVTGNSTTPPPTTTPPTPVPAPTPKPPSLSSRVVPIADVSNGCGGEGKTAIAQNLLLNTHTYYESILERYTVTFTAACNIHDAGYSGAVVRDNLAGGRIVDFSTWSRRQVDDEFLKNLQARCRIAIPAQARIARAKCLGYGGKDSIGVLAIYAGVREFGDEYFDADPSTPGIQRTGPRPNN